MLIRGVPRIFSTGFPQVIDPRCRCLGAQPPDADELLYLFCHLVVYFNLIWVTPNYILHVCSYACMSSSIVNIIRI